jgi:four helix bundle protein
MRDPAKTFEDLVVWQKAHQFVLSVYRLSRTFPPSETYGLSSQFRRAAVSIAANIAEGFRKRGKADKLRFLNIAQGSTEESRYYLILAETSTTAMSPTFEQCWWKSASCWKRMRRPFGILNPES